MRTLFTLGTTWIVSLCLLGSGLAETGKIRCERWLSTWPKDLAELRDDGVFSGDPDVVDYLTSLELEHFSNNHFGNEYTTRMCGYLVPKVTGDYELSICGDDRCELWLSDDDSPFNRRRVARVFDWSWPGQWDKYLAQKAEPVHLEAGKKYYIEVIQQEDAGWDHVAVGWRPAGDGADPEIIQGEFLAPYEGHADDVDRDGLPDSWEVATGLDASSGEGIDGSHGDPDGDSLTNLEELRHGSDPNVADAAGRVGLVSWQAWHSVWGGYVFDLTGASQFPTNPDAMGYTGSIEAPRDMAENCGLRMRGYLRPEKSGKYTFWLAGDDGAELWVSKTSSKFQKELVASVPGFVGFRDVDRFAEQKSNEIRLKKGEEYYFEVLLKEDKRDDHVTVAWQRNGGDREVIGGDSVRSYAGDPEDADDNDLPDRWEQRRKLAEVADEDDPNLTSAYGDIDGDTLTNGEEFRAGSNPRKAQKKFAKDRVSWEIWRDVPGRRLEALADAPDYPARPAESGYRRQLDGSADGETDYVQRMRGYLVPKVDNVYTFRVSGDDHCQLWLNPEGSSKFKKRLIAENGGRTIHRDFWKHAGQQSEQFTLKAGKRYYIELLHKQGASLSHASASWQRYTDDFHTVILGDTLLPYRTSARDKDDDDLPDPWEKRHGLSSSDPSGENGAHGDPDGDFLTNLEEFQLGTHPQKADAEGRPGLVLWEAWDGVFDGHLSALVGASEFPASPTYRGYRTALEGPQDFGEHYGSRMRAFVTPPESGDYTFHLSGDDNTELWFSTDDDKFNRQRIASVPGFTGYHEYEKFAEQTSPTYPLEKGKRYYIEVRQKEGIYEDHVSVAWSSAATGGLPVVIDGDSVFAFKKHPNDQDDDDLPDDWERKNGLDPRDGSHANSAYGDADGDGLDNTQELALGTSPTAVDTDGDGLTDYVEAILIGTDPSGNGGHAPETVAESTGENLAPISGQWSSAGASVVSVSQKGRLAFDLSIESPGLYLVEISGQPAGIHTEYEELPITVILNEVAVADLVLVCRDGGESVVMGALPWLAVGDHQLTLYFDNEKVGRRIQIDRVGLVDVGGHDLDEDGQADWWGSALASRNSVAPVTASSPISPLFIEGNSLYPDLVSTGAPVHRGPDGMWFADVPLNADGSETSLAVTFEGGGVEEEVTVAWSSTDVLGADDLTLRRGDALRLAIGGEERAAEAQLSLNGAPLATLQPGEVLAHVFEEAGTYVLSASAGGQSGDLVVEVVGADFGSGFSVVPSTPRQWVCPDVPRALPVQTGETVSMEELTVEVGRAFTVTASASGVTPVIARLVDGGAVVARSEINAVEVLSSETTGVNVVRTFEDGAELVEMVVAAKGLHPGLRIRFEIFVSGVTFEDGSIVMFLEAGDFNENGLAKVRFHRPAEVTTSVCHRMFLYEGDTNLGEL